MALIIKCPTCKKLVHYTADNPYRPFCSRRCRFVDMGRWLEEDYKIEDDQANVDEGKSIGENEILDANLPIEHKDNINAGLEYILQPAVNIIKKI